MCDLLVGYWRECCEALWREEYFNFSSIHVVSVDIHHAILCQIYTCTNRVEGNTGNRGRTRFVFYILTFNIKSKDVMKQVLSKAIK